MGWLASAVGKTRRNASMDLIYRALRRRPPLIDTRYGSSKRSLREPLRAGISSAKLTPDIVGLF